MILWQRRESLAKSKSESVSVSFSTTAKVTAQDFGSMKEQRAVSMLSSSTTTTNKINHSSPTKWQVLPLSQKSFLLYISGVQPLCWLTTLFHELKTKASLFSHSGLNRTQAPWIHEHDQVGYPLARHPYCLTEQSTYASMPPPTRKPRAFFQTGSNKIENAPRMLGSLTFLPSSRPSSLKKCPSCICKPALCINEVSGLTDRVPIT